MAYLRMCLIFTGELNALRMRTRATLEDERAALALRLTP